MSWQLMTPLAVGMAALGVAVQLTGAAAGPTGLLNASLYRVSPLTYPGVQNMDTGESSLCSQRSGASAHSALSALILLRAQATPAATSASGSGRSPCRWAAAPRTT